jgi:hypothetical protein
VVLTDGDDIVQAGRTERCERGEEVIVKGGLANARLGEVSRERNGLVASHEEGYGRAGKESGQAVWRKQSDALQELVVVRDRLEQGCSKPP